jgi:CheY-like chemotaxis protein
MISDPVWFRVPDQLVIPLTASAFAEDRERWFEAGMDDYLSKPVRSE